MPELSRHPLYPLWNAMIRRCHSPKASGYQNYGARGIRVCKRWHESFHAFVVDMGERPEGYSLDRIDPDGDYSPDNCRWVPKSENLARSNAENPRRRGNKRLPVAAPTEWMPLEERRTIAGLMDTAHAAKYLRLGVATLHRWRKVGYGPPHVEMGRKVYYRPADIERWIDEQQSRKSQRPGFA